MSEKKHSKAYEAALCGISCAVAAGGLALGLLSGYFVATGYLIAITALMVPLSKKMYLGDLLAYIGTCILAVVLGAAVQFWDLVPFAIFFGLHPLVNALQLKFKINKWIALPVKALWFDGMLIASYFIIFNGVFGGSVFPEEFYKTVNDYVYLFVFTLGTVIFVAYDFLIFRVQQTLNKIIFRVIK